MSDLLSEQRVGQREILGKQACVLYGFALPYAKPLLEAIEGVLDLAPLRHMVTPGGFKMSVKSSNCGLLGWVSDSKGYRYSAIDPLTKQAWPAMPDVFSALAHDAAQEAGFSHFLPDACLLNCYTSGTRMSLHQDKNERDFSQPIVSISLGMSAIFQFGGLARNTPVQKVLLEHGDVVVWGGDDRLRFHGVMALGKQPHVLLGNQRFNLTLRKAG